MTLSLPPEVRHGIDSARRGDYLMGLTVLADFYENYADALDAPEGLSWYALCLANVTRQFDLALRICQSAIDMEPNRATHHLNAAQIHLLKGDRKSAVDSVEEGLAVEPDSVPLRQLRDHLGVRAEPAIRFLDRSHAFNVALGQVRHVTRKRPAKKK